MYIWFEMCWSLYYLIFLYVKWKLVFGNSVVFMGFDGGEDIGYRDRENVNWDLFNFKGKFCVKIVFVDVYLKNCF